MILIVVEGLGEMSVSQKTHTSPIVLALDISKVNLTTSYTFLSCVKLFPVWTKSLKCIVPITHLQEQNQELTELVPLELFRESFMIGNPFTTVKKTLCALNLNMLKFASEFLEYFLVTDNKRWVVNKQIIERNLSSNSSF